MAKVTWNGAKDDPDWIAQYGVTFPKGEAVEVDNDHPQMAKFKGNAYFDVEGADESEPDGALYVPVHKGRGVWAVKGPDGSVTPATFSKDEAIAYAEEKNTAPSDDNDDGA